MAEREASVLGDLGTRHNTKAFAASLKFFQSGCILIQSKPIGFFFPKQFLIFSSEDSKSSRLSKAVEVLQLRACNIIGMKRTELLLQEQGVPEARPVLLVVDEGRRLDKKRCCSVSSLLSQQLDSYFQLMFEWSTFTKKSKSLFQTPALKENFTCFYQIGGKKADMTCRMCMWWRLLVINLNCGFVIHPHSAAGWISQMCSDIVWRLPSFGNKLQISSTQVMAFGKLQGVCV